MPALPALAAMRLPIICLAAIFWAFSFGVSSEVASVWLQRAGYGDTIVGLNTSVYYLGIALAANLVPWTMRRWGRPALALGMIASGVTVVAFPWGAGLTGWFFLRALNGVAGAMTLIPLETLVNRTSPPQRRSRNFGLYAVAVAVGLALGAWLGMTVNAQSPTLAFSLGGGVTLIFGTGTLYWLPEYRGLTEERHERTSLGWVRNFFSFGTAWSQGFLEGGMVSQLPIYLLALGLSDEAVGQMLGGLMVGVIVAQVPVAWLADRLGRTQVLFGCYGAVAIGLIWLWSCGGSGGMPLALFVVGACSGAFYPLGLAILGERLPASGLAQAGGWFLAINCVGSITGPMAAGVMMDRFGSNALFLAGEAALLLVLVGWGCVHLVIRLRRRLPVTERQERRAA